MPNRVEVSTVPSPGTGIATGPSFARIARSAQLVGYSWRIVHTRMPFEWCFKCSQGRVVDASREKCGGRKQTKYIGATALRRSGRATRSRQRGKICHELLQIACSPAPATRSEMGLAHRTFHEMRMKLNWNAPSRVECSGRYQLTGMSTRDERERRVLEPSEIQCTVSTGGGLLCLQRRISSISTITDNYNVTRSGNKQV